MMEIEKCTFCGKQFKKKKYLSVHLKEKHKTNAKGKPLSASEEKKIQCVLCDKIFKRKQHLENHMAGIHFQETGEILKCTFCKYSSNFKYNLRRHILKLHTNSGTEQTTEKNYRCCKCSANFKYKSSLKRHEKKNHNLQLKQNKLLNRRKCPLCPFDTSNFCLNSMYVHFENIHNISLKWEKHSFSSLDEFYDWKRRTEKQTISSYVRRSKSKNGSTFQCQRCGVFKSSGRNRRHRKITGSCKINSFCPSRIKVGVKNNCVTAVYQPVHVGHKHELKHIRLRKEERKYLASKLIQKVPHEEILRNIRGSLTNSDLQRIHLINKKDLRNIERDFNLNLEVIHHPYDPVSIESWVMNLNKSKDTALLFYKRQGEKHDKYPSLEENNFVLIFMTTAQVSFLKKFGRDTVCIDGTHGLNNYNFQLFTLLVLDEGREGFPVGFMFSNKGDENNLRIFFKEIQTVAGKITPNVFMSDMEETFYVAWKNVMGPARNRIFCSWHVLRAWKGQINNKITNKEQRNNVFKMLKCLLYELDVHTFMRLLESVLNKLKTNEETLPFYNYFEQFYVRNEKCLSWAYCYRANIGINTNMSIENFNKVLKYIYLRGKRVKRLDKTLCAILHLLKDKLFDYIIKTEKGKVVRKLQILRQRHNRVITMNEENIVEMDDKWQILSSGFEVYTIKRIKTCKTCQLQCLHCDSCFHEFNCTCMDNAIKNNMCKHIHLVARKIMKDGRKFEETSRPTELQDDPQVKEIVLKESSCEESSSDFEEKKQILLSEVSKLEEFIKNNLTTHDQIDFMMRTIKQSIITTEAMKSSNPLQEPAPSSKPGNTNLVKQRRFIAPLKNKKNVKKEVSSTEEMQRISLSLLMEKQESSLHSKTNLTERVSSTDHDHTYCKHNSVEK